MPRCGCQDSCSCLITAGSGITVEGIGTLERPYEISSESDDAGQRIHFADDGSVDFTTTGVGSVLDPLVVSGDVALNDLTDVTGTPAEGNVPVWRTDHWAFESPAAAAIPVSGVWGTAPLEVYGSDSLIGREIYLDSAGQLRAKPDVTEMGAGVDLNTVTRTGQWTQSQTAEATLVLNYPVPVAGLLEVTSNALSGASAMTWQRYTAYATHGTYGGKVYTRGKYGSTWDPWTEVSGIKTPHICRTKTTNQTLASASTYYVVTFEADDQPAVGITYSAGTFTVPEDGIYQLNANLLCGGTSTTQMRLSITVTNPSEAAANYGVPATNTAGNSMIWFARAIRMKAGATLTISAWANATGQNITGSSTNFSNMSLTKIAP